MPTTQVTQEELDARDTRRTLVAQGADRILDILAEYRPDDKLLILSALEHERMLRGIVQMDLTETLFPKVRIPEAMIARHVPVAAPDPAPSQDESRMPSP